MNVNKNTQPGVFKTKQHTWTLSNHPEGGPWSFDDISKLKAGVRLNFSNGPNGKPYIPIGSQFYARVTYFRVLLEVVDLGGDLDNIRKSSMSERIRLTRCRCPPLSSVGKSRRMPSSKPASTARRSVPGSALRPIFGTRRPG